ncbi:LacI family transcriptional regulator [Desertihabitans brevis]|uniref:LacI family transcriptional regulator n=1 Tax=Desertihabitans brevis TaxID=2268447 RepID=A0A367YTH2_9ACTN|nr:LacI family transcriptional regulator [Desertihabitans brevis]
MRARRGRVRSGHYDRPVRKVTSADVARRAGVSRAAVSMVLNGRAAGNVSADRQEAIRAAARELGYVPDAAAVAMRTQRTRTLGVVTDAIVTTAYGGDVLAGAMDAAARSGYVTMVVETEDDPELEQRAFEALRRRQVDGYVFAAASMRTYSVAEEVGSTPAVLANCIDPDRSHAAWYPDDVGGGRLATEALLVNGHTELVCLAGAEETMATGLRVQGYQEALARAGRRPGPVHPTGWEIADGHRAAMALLTGPDRPTGIVCANDRVAVGVLLAATALGLRVPDDLSLVGYDDDVNVAPTLVPGLTTIGLPHREMGQRATDALLERLAGGPLEPAQVAVEATLVQRASVAAPPF